jgi:tetratricopeptide (TPR) repeat protein
MPSSSPRADIPEFPPPRWLPWSICAVTLLLYLPTLRFEFVYDDTSQIVNNPLVHSWRNLPLLFRTDVWRFQNPLVVGSFWRPVFMAWLLLNHTLFGLNSIGWHAAAVAIYALSVYLVYRLTLRLSGDAWLAGIAAFLFAAHPAHLETVAWVSGATDSLLSVFIVGSLLCLIRSREKEEQSPRRSLWISFSLLLFILALLTKETAMIEPFLVAACLLMFSTRGASVFARMRAAIPFLILAALYLEARRFVLGAVSHSYLRMAFSDALLTVPSVLWFYLKHLLWPVRLSVIYDASPVLRPAWQNFWWPLCANALVTISLCAYLLRTRDRLAAFGALLVLLPLLPVLYVPALEPGNFLHDRYLYLPSLGFAIIVASALRRLSFGSARLFGLPAIQAATALAIFLAGAAATASQQTFWANDVLLFSRATEIAPANETAFLNLGTALAVRGHAREARFAFAQVLRRNPNSWQAQYNLGLGYFLDGKYLEAEVYLQKAVELNPLEGDAAAALAEDRVRQGDYKAAEPVIRQAIALKPYKPGYRRVLALSLEGQGRHREALEAAEDETSRFPDDFEAQDLVKRLRRESVPN